MSMLETHPDFSALLSQHPFPLAFVSVGGSHLYGYATEQSDYDLYGMHLVPTRDLLTLAEMPQTVEWKAVDACADVDGATHDMRKYLSLLLKGNGNYLEVLYASNVIVTSPLHAEMQALARGCITRRLKDHYRGMAQNQQRRMRSNRLKSLLHSYRCLCAGVHVLRTGELLANVYALSDATRTPGLRQLADYKRAGGTADGLSEREVALHMADIQQLEGVLDEAERTSTLPPEATCEAAFNDLLLRVRLERLEVVA
jgi:uncharacterized protein